MFQIGDKVVHPMHGAGTIADMVTEKICGRIQDYYVFKMSVGGLVLKIPVATSAVIGLRDVVGSEEAACLLAALPALETDMTSNWNHRYRENMERLKSGDLYQVARVIKGLHCRDARRGLSNGERKMLHTAKQILISELVLATGEEYPCLEARINAAMSGVKAG